MMLDRGLGLDKRAKMFVGSVTALQMIVLVGSVIRDITTLASAQMRGWSREGPGMGCNYY